MASSDTGEVKDPAKALRTAQFLGGLGRAVKSAAGPGVQLRAAEPLLGEVIQLRHQ